MTAARAPLHVPADLDATLHAAICDLRTTTRLKDGTRSEQVAKWAAEIELVAGPALAFLDGLDRLRAEVIAERSLEWSA